MKPLGRFIIDRFLLLPLGAAIGLIWANTAGESYFRTAHALAFPVNEIGMALFLALITQEIVESVMPGGALHTWRRWGLPLIGAVGGAVGAAAAYYVYVGLKYEQVLITAWPVAIAVDVAAGYYLLKLIKARHSAIPFLLVLAFATNGLVLTVMTVWPFHGGAAMIEGGLLVLGALTLAAVLRRRRVRAFWPYLAVCGPLSWFGLWIIGVHPALALIPIVPFLPHEPRRGNPFGDPADDDAVHHVEHEWNYAVQGVLFLFGLVNAGVQMSAYDTGTWAVLIAALVGRPAGIFIAVSLALAAGWHLPRRMNWRDLVVVALATSSGFTFALFVATSLLPAGAVLGQIKIGALATAAGALAAVAAARLLHVGRFAHHREVARGISPQARPAH
jgi:NhaA family Na+:H+ antiporter